MNWPDGITLFLKYLEKERGYSLLTCSAYKRDLDEWMDFLGDLAQDDLVMVKYKTLKPFISEQVEKGITGRSISRKISALRSFYKFALKEEWTKNNEAQQLKPPKSPKKLPEFVREKAMDQFFERGEDILKGSFPLLRDYLVVMLLYCCGLRRAELLGLCPADFDTNRKVLRVLGKRNKVRMIPLLPEIWPVYEKYMEEIISFGLGERNKPFIYTDGLRPAYPEFIYRLVKRNLAEITTQDKKSPHVLRHTFATHLLNQGADINAIKELLGHSSLAATQVYTHNSFEQLKKIHKQAHPKG